MAKQCVVNRNSEGEITSVEVENPDFSDQSFSIEQAIEKNNGLNLDKAPNGENSLLYQSFLDQGLSEKESQKKVAQVYSDNFLDWFGDWLNNPEESSKVVDANGQPLIVWSGQETKVEEFRAYTNRIEGSENISNDGFFAEDKRVAQSYATGLDAFTTPQVMIEKYGSKTASIVPVFLNIRSQIESDDINRTTLTPLIETAIKNKNDGFHGKFHNYDSNGWVALDGDQIQEITNDMDEIQNFNRIDENNMIPSQLYEQLKQQPFINQDQALEAYKNIYTESAGNWQDSNLEC